MSSYSVSVEVRLREGIADPQGSTVERSIPALGYNNISNVKIGKLIHLDIEAASEAEAKQIVEDLCQKFLTNPVIEDSLVTVNSPAVV